MSFFDGFTTFNFGEGVPFASITKNGITFNKGVIMKMDFPKNVILLVNASTKQIAIQASSENAERATPFLSDEKRMNKVYSVRWNSRDLLNTITAITGWNLEKKGYKVEGQLIPEENAMLFDLNNAEPLD